MLLIGPGTTLLCGDVITGLTSCWIGVGETALFSGSINPFGYENSLALMWSGDIAVGGKGRMFFEDLRLGLVSLIVSNTQLFSGAAWKSTCVRYDS